jgi:hypothetical protein
MFVERWLQAIPAPLDDLDQAGGYPKGLSTRQVELSRTIVFDAPPLWPLRGNRGLQHRHQP